jgi:hypothetical protein
VAYGQEGGGYEPGLGESIPVFWKAARVVTTGTGLVEKCDGDLADIVFERPLLCASPDLETC